MKTSITILMSMILLSVYPSFAQDAAPEAPPEWGWKNAVNGNLNFTQNAFSDTWRESQGGDNSWSGQLDILAKFENDQPGMNWRNSGKISYGKSAIGEQDARKSVDEINLESVITKKLEIFVSPYAAVKFQSQLTEGKSYESADDNVGTPISNLFDPAYLTESFGVGFEPAKDTKSRLGLAFKQTFADEFAFADDLSTPDKFETLRSEIGLESVTDFTRTVMENITYTSKLELFSDFKGRDAVPATVDIEGNELTPAYEELSVVDRVDVRWDNIIAAQVNKYIKVSFNFQMFKDADIVNKSQFKQVLAAGLTYSFL